MHWNENQNRCSKLLGRLTKRRITLSLLSFGVVSNLRHNALNRVETVYLAADALPGEPAAVWAAGILGLLPAGSIWGETFLRCRRPQVGMAAAASLRRLFEPPSSKAEYSYSETAIGPAVLKCFGIGLFWSRNDVRQSAR